MENFSRNISVIKDCDNKKIVVINDIIFKGKKDILSSMSGNFTGLQKIMKLYI